MAPRVFVVIPTHNRLALTRACLLRLNVHSGPDSPVVVLVDDGSSDGTAHTIAREFPDVVVLRGDGTLWWAGSTNRGVGWALAHAADDDVVITLNDDTLPSADFVDRLLRAHEAEPHALIGSLLLSSSDEATVLEGGVSLTWSTAKIAPRGAGERWEPPRADGPPLLRPTDVLPGCGTLVPVSAFRTAGPYRDRWLRHYAADYEFSLRARRAGYDLYVDWASPLIVHETATGLHAAASVATLGGLLTSLWNRKSATDLRTRLAFAVTACPPWALPLFLPFDIARVLLGGALRYGRTKAAGSAT
jgi:GT2 family glycosyltransferase